MALKKPLFCLFLFAAAIVWLAPHACSQGKYYTIKLPPAINNLNEEFSGLAKLNNRVYLLPQYGSHKETGLDGDFNIYSISTNSINRVLKGKDTALTAYQTISVLNLDKLPPSIKKYYEGMEAIVIVNNRVYLSVETIDSTANCYLLKGTLDARHNKIIIDPNHYITLKRPAYIKNAGFESLTYLPAQNKLLVMYEFNAFAGGGKGYLINPSFTSPPLQVKTPFLYFRITDMATAKNGRIYGINYYWNGDYNYYLNNKILSNAEAGIKQTIPNLRDSMAVNPGYLTNSRTTYARIVSLKNYKAGQWRQVACFDGFRNNWEGLVLFKKGALIISDANRSPKQVTTFAYVAF